MKNTKICPKCGFGEVVRIDGNVGAYGTGNNIPMGFTIWSYVKVARYVCTACGYTEEWIDKDDLGKIKEKYGGR